MCAISIIEGGALHRDGGAKTPCRWCYFSVQVVLMRRNSHERLNREIRRRTRVVGTFPDGNSALMLVCARLRHVAGTQWGNKKYMSMKHLKTLADQASAS